MPNILSALLNRIVWSNTSNAADISKDRSEVAALRPIADLMSRYTAPTVHMSYNP
jgi:hypothetical protein